VCWIDVKQWEERDKEKTKRSTKKGKLEWGSLWWYEAHSQTRLKENCHLSIFLSILDFLTVYYSHIWKKGIQLLFNFIPLFCFQECLQCLPRILFCWLWFGIKWCSLLCSQCWSKRRLGWPLYEPLHSSAHWPRQINLCACVLLTVFQGTQVTTQVRGKKFGEERWQLGDGRGATAVMMVDESCFN